MFQPIRGSIVLQNIRAPYNAFTYGFIGKSRIETFTGQVSYTGFSDGTIDFGLLEILLTFGAEQKSEDLLVRRCNYLCWKDSLFGGEMDEIYVVVYYLNNRTTASHNIQEDFFPATRRIFTASHGKSFLNLILADWNNGAAGPFKDRSRLRAFQ